jgi:hypothetical protein
MKCALHNCLCFSFADFGFLFDIFGSSLTSSSDVFISSIISSTVLDCPSGLNK